MHYSFLMLTTFQFRNEKTFAGINHIHFGPNYSNYLVLPIIPEKK